MNVLAYIVYLFITYLITIRVGWRFYRAGEVYIFNLLAGDHKLTHFINRLLLVGYYLLNLGYVALMLHRWEKVDSLLMLIDTVTAKTAQILLLLGIMHFFNMAALLWLSRHQHLINHQQNAE